MGAHTGDALDVASRKYRKLALLRKGESADIELAVVQGVSGFAKLVVLKSFKPELAEDPSARSRFLQAARLTARLNHPNIVQTNEIAEQDGVPLIVTEFLEGQPLSTLFARGRGTVFTLAMHLRVIADLLSGLHYAHELSDFDGAPLGLVHRDITPHNVYVTFDGQVKIIDFGLAKIDAGGVEMPVRAVTKNNVRYMSPEELKGEPLDRRADIFSVGVMLWEAATGERIWKGLDNQHIIHYLLNGALPPPSTINPEVPRSLERVILRALAVHREERQRTAIELLAEIEEVLSEIGSASSRDVAKVVSALFEDVRQNTRALIEDQLSKLASLASAEFETYESGRGVLHDHSAASTRNFTGTGTVSAVIGTADIPAPAPTSRRWLALSAVAFVLLAGFSFWRLQGGIAPHTPVAQATVNEAPVQVVEKPAQNQLSVRVSTVPADAKVYLDGQLVENPFHKMMPRDGSRRMVHAEAEGYASSTQAIVLDKEQDVFLVLEPVKETAPTSARAPVRTRYVAAPIRRVRQPVADHDEAPAVTSTPSPKKSEDCNPPYYVDGRGIKRFKSECM